jgi:hypothetical protein
LQGLWKETGRPKQWLVKGHSVTAVKPDGEMGRKFTVNDSADGNVQWGTHGKYFLDRQFDIGTDIAIWRLGSPDGPEGFSWTFVKDLLPPPPGFAEHSSETPGITEKKKKMLPSGGQAGSSGHHGQSSRGERRMDPADGRACTWLGMFARYAGEYTNQESRAYWEACSSTSPERRIDPVDDMPYSWREMKAFYANDYTLLATSAYWDACEKEDAGE